MIGNLHYESPVDGFPVSFNGTGRVAICDKCNLVMGLIDTLESGTSHLISCKFTCVDCLKKQLANSRIPDEVEGARIFVQNIVRMAERDRQ